MTPNARLSCTGSTTFGAGFSSVDWPLANPQKNIVISRQMGKFIWKVVLYWDDTNPSQVTKVFDLQLVYIQAKSLATTSPCTSVSLKWRPWNLYVNRL